MQADRVRCAKSYLVEAKAMPTASRISSFARRRTSLGILSYEISFANEARRVAIGPLFASVSPLGACFGKGIALLMGVPVIMSLRLIRRQCRPRRRACQRPVPEGAGTLVAACRLAPAREEAEPR